MSNKVSLQNQLQNPRASDPEESNEVFDRAISEWYCSITIANYIGPVWFCSALVNSDTLTDYYGVKQSHFTKPTLEPPR